MKKQSLFKLKRLSPRAVSVADYQKFFNTTSLCSPLRALLRESRNSLAAHRALVEFVNAAKGDGETVLLVDVPNKRAGYIARNLAHSISANEISAERGAFNHLILLNAEQYLTNDSFTGLLNRLINLSTAHILILSASSDFELPSAAVKKFKT